MDAYLGEIRIFCGTFAPVNWMLCEGQLLPITSNTALFSIIGTNYGGNGRTTFALPDLSGNVPISQGQGSGLTMRSVGEMGGSAAVTLQQGEMPGHTHVAMGAAKTGTSNSPANAVWSQFAQGGRPPIPINLYGSPSDVQMAPGALAAAGQSNPHNNMQPYLALRFIICVQGNFPPRQ